MRNIKSCLSGTILAFIYIPASFEQKINFLTNRFNSKKTLPVILVRQPLLTDRLIYRWLVLLALHHLIVVGARSKVRDLRTLEHPRGWHRALHCALK